MPTSPVLAAVEAALVQHFGATPQRASVSFVGVEPIEVLRFEPIPGERAYLSLGMAARPMTGADRTVVAAHGPRAELMLHVRDPLDNDTEVWRRLAVLAAAPVVEAVVYSPGMSVDLGESFVAGSACTGVVVATSSIARIEIPDAPVSVYAAVPATAAELAWARARGAEELQRRWTAAGTDLLNLHRRAVGLD